MSEAERLGRLRERYLRVAYDLTVNRSAPLVSIMDVASELGLPADRLTLMNPSSEIMGLARYWSTRGCIRSQMYGYETFSLTPEGMREAEGQNKPPDTGISNVFNIEHAYGSVIGTHNKADLANTFDFRSIEQRIERDGGEDEEELKRALDRVERLIERGEYLDRGALSEFSGAMERHSWFTGAVAQALVGFATQVAGG